MNEQVSSVLPILVFALPAGAALLSYLAGRISGRLRDLVVVLGTAAPLAICVPIWQRVLAGRTLIFWSKEFLVDGLSALMVTVISLIGLIASLYAIKYMRHHAQLRWQEQAGHRLDIFYLLYLLFISTMLWGSVTNNVIMLYVAVEATTIASALLVAFSWDRRGLEAAYKYLMLLTVGITFALFGCVLLYAASAPHLPGASAMLISEIRGIVGLLPRSMVVVIAAFLVVGFGTKAGIAPFHPWLPDAHAEAPTPVSALLSGVMIKMAAYALARTLSIFYPSWPALGLFVVILGVFTMLLGVVMALVQDDLKRLLAYSSVSQMGYVMMGLGIGSYLGVYGGLFHLVNHAIYKALLFLCTGAVIYATGIRSIRDLGGLSRKMPVTSACFFVGALSLSGMPPFNGFMSKITVYLAGAQAHMWWATALAIAAGILTLVALIHAAYAVFWGRPSEKMASLKVKEVPASIWAPMVALAGLCLLLGVYPQLIYPALNSAAHHLTAPAQHLMAGR